MSQDSQDSRSQAALSSASPAHVSQRVSRLAPLDAIFRKIDALAVPVKPEPARLAAALGRVLAADIAAPHALPAAAAALHDGLAVRAEVVADAGSYAPVALVPKPVWVEAGDAMPADTDAVLPEDVVTANGEALAAATPGDGVLAAAGDMAAGAVLARAGERLRPLDLAILQAAGIKTLAVRVPKIRVVAGNAVAGAADTVAPLIARLVEASGGIARHDAKPLADALADTTADAVIVVGGSGAGHNDRSVTTLATAGRVDIHGMAIRPGASAALGAVDARPVLIVPGRLDAALAVFAIAGLRMIAKLAGRGRYIATVPVTLTRKVASPVGVAEFVALERIAKDIAAPHAAAPIPLAALARADGWLLVRAESEGYPEGAPVEMRLFP